MTSISLSSSSSLPYQINVTASSIPAEKDAVTQLNEQMTKGIYVNLSEQAKAKSREAEKNKDIDASDLPDNIKDLLKQIRELKAEIAEKRAELQEAMIDQKLTDEEREVKTRLLQTELSGLTNALNNANSQLMKVLEDGALSDEQKATAAALAM